MDRVIVKGMHQLPSRKPCNCKTKEDKAENCYLDVRSYPQPQRFGNKNAFVYNSIVKSEPINSIKKDDKDCKCFPTPPKRPCNTLDCECITHDIEACSRRRHKSFCPSYKHKDTCPATKKINDEEALDVQAEEDVERLPYGLPPVKLGPCPVPGRPCSGPDAMARISKNPAPTPQPTVTIPGKISCSKEYERIKKAMLDFIKEQEKPQFECINKFNVDTEKRCCDADQRLFSMVGKSCCAEHKLAADGPFKEQQEREASERRNAQE